MMDIKKHLKTNLILALTLLAGSNPRLIAKSLEQLRQEAFQGYGVAADAFGCSLPFILSSIRPPWQTTDAKHFRGVNKATLNDWERRIKLQDSSVQMQPYNSTARGWVGTKELKKLGGGHWTTVLRAHDFLFSTIEKLFKQFLFGKNLKAEAKEALIKKFLDQNLQNMTVDKQDVEICTTCFCEALESARIKDPHQLC